MVKSEITTEELLAELSQKYNRELQNGDITVRMFSESSGLTTDGARKVLLRAVQHGELIELDPILIDRCWVSVFRKKVGAD